MYNNFKIYDIDIILIEYNLINKKYIHMIILTKLKLKRDWICEVIFNKINNNNLNIINIKNINRKYILLYKFNYLFNIVFLIKKKNKYS